MNAILLLHIMQTPIFALQTYKLYVNFFLFPEEEERPILATDRLRLRLRLKFIHSSCKQKPLTAADTGVYEMQDSFKRIFKSSVRRVMFRDQIRFFFRT